MTSDPNLGDDGRIDFVPEPSVVGFTVSSTQTGATTYVPVTAAPGSGRYLYVRCHMDALQANLDLRAGQGYRVHTITHNGSLVHVLFEKG